MLSSRLSRYEIRGGRVEPCTIDGRYAAMIRSLVLHYEAFAGKRYSELEDALSRWAEGDRAEPRLVQGLREVIEESVELEEPAVRPASRVRETVFALAASKPDMDPRSVREEAASALGVAAEEVQGLLYSDLPAERRIALRRPIPAVAEIISRYNFRLVQSLFPRAERVRVETDGNLRPVVRLAKLNGLLLEVRSPREGGRPPRLEVTGPLSLFRQTRKYALSLARFLPACATGNRWTVEGTLVLRGKRFPIRVTEADRVLSPHAEPRLHDSKLEERFHADFLALGSRWEIRRETDLVQLGSTAFLPDFTLRPRSGPPIEVDLEIVGFWTRDYLERKRSIWDRLGARRVIFCVDDRLRCDRDAEPHAFLSFRRRVPAGEVLRLLEKMASEDVSQAGARP